LLRIVFLILMMSQYMPSLRIFSDCTQAEIETVRRCDRTGTRPHLLHWDAAREQLDQVARFDDNVRVPGFARGLASTRHSVPRIECEAHTFTVIEPSNRLSSQATP
jgi:hypothetical protein